LIFSGKAKLGRPSTIKTIPKTLRKNFMRYPSKFYDVHLESHDYMAQV
jgi:hypothetical protein